MASSESVPRARRRASRTEREGGAMKQIRGLSEGEARTCFTPCWGGRGGGVSVLVWGEGMGRRGGR